MEKQALDEVFVTQSKYLTAVLQIKKQVRRDRLFKITELEDYDLVLQRLHAGNLLQNLKLAKVTVYGGRSGHEEEEEAKWPVEDGSKGHRSSAPVYGGRAPPWDQHAHTFWLPRSS